MSSSEEKKMKELKLLAILAIAMAFVMSAGAHPGPERHPIEQELFDVETQLSAKVSELERSLNARIESLDAPDQDAIADAIDKALADGLVEISQSTDDLQDQIEEIVAGNRQLMYFGLFAIGLMFTGFIGLFVYIQSKSKKTT